MGEKEPVLYEDGFDLSYWRVLACGCPQGVVADEGHQEGCLDRTPPYDPYRGDDLDITDPTAG